MSSEVESTKVERSEDFSSLYGEGITLPRSSISTGQAEGSSLRYSAGVNAVSEDKSEESSNLYGAHIALPNSTKSSSLRYSVEKETQTKKETHDLTDTNCLPASPYQGNSKPESPPHRISRSSNNKTVPSGPPESITISILAPSGEPVQERHDSPDDVSAMTNPTDIRTIVQNADLPWMNPIIEEYKNEPVVEPPVPRWKRNKRCLLWLALLVVACVIGVVVYVLASQLRSSESPSSTTGRPQTNPPSTPVPTSQTSSPSEATGPPTTIQPSTPVPSTLPPSTTQPSTPVPSTLSPSTAQPSTSIPSTLSPSTTQPSTPVPSNQTSSPSETTLPPTTTPNLIISGAKVSISGNGAIVSVGVNGQVDTFRRLDENWDESLGDLPEDPPSGDLATALSGDGSRLVVGAETAAGLNGQVQVWTRDVIGGSDSSLWTKLGNELTGDPLGGLFGHSLAISSDGTTIAVGAPGAFDDTGQVTVYRLDGSQWSSVASVRGQNPGDAFGTSTSLSSNGSTLAVGAPQQNVVSGKGYVQMYTLGSSLSTSLGGTIEGDAAGDRFGASVSLSSDASFVAVGAWGNDPNGQDSGQARVFGRSDGDTWDQIGNTVTGDEAGDAFGYSVSLIADEAIVLAVGAPQPFTSAKAGYIRAFRFTSGTWDSGGVDPVLGDPGQQLGFSVSLGQDSTFVYIVWGTGLNDEREWQYGVDYLAK